MTVTKTEIDINFYVYGHDLDPDQITDILQLQPCATGRRGVRRVGSKGQQYAPLKAGVWGYKIRGTDVAQLVDQFLSQLGKRDHILEGIPNAEEGYIEIYAVLTSENGDAQCFIELSSSQHQALAAYGLPLRFTVDVVGPD